jgi:hypothetical protein
VISAPPEKVSETPGDVVSPKRRDRPAIASTRCTTRCIVDIPHSPMPAAVPTVACQGSTARRSRDIEAYGVDAWLDELAED